MSRIVGIDLGTSNCVLAVLEDGEPRVVTTAEGKRVPSIVAFSKNGERLVGHTAKRQAMINAENSVFSVKRLLGRRYDDPETKLEQGRISPQLIEGPKGDIRIFIPSARKQFTPQEIAAILLNQLKKEAEAYLGEPVEQAVITVPAYFTDAQRQAVRDAGKIAGLDVLRIINEPTAAALTYGRDCKDDQLILVFDLGGGTLDVSVLQLRDGLIEVRATAGDANLGGEDWDEALVDWLLNQFLRTHGVDLRKKRQALQRIREAAEQAKIKLSTATSAEINLPFILADGNGPKHLHTTITRARYERLTQHLVERLNEPVQRALADAGVEAHDLDAVLLVGGMTRVPTVRQLVRQLTGHEPTPSIDPDEIVVCGAALQAGALAGELQDVHLRDVTPLSLGLETMGGMMTILIPRNTPIPTSRSEVFSTVEDEQTEVNIHVLLGERIMAADNNTLGVFRLQGIPPAPRGVPQIEVTFEIDANGILHVSAQDRSTGTRQTVTLSASTNLSEEDIERIVLEAEECVSEDKQWRELLEARNLAEQAIYQTQRNLEYLNGSTPEPGRQEIAVQMAALQAAVAGDDVQRIRRLTAALQHASMAWSQCMLSPQPARPEPSPGS